MRKNVDQKAANVDQNGLRVFEKMVITLTMIMFSTKISLEYSECWLHKMLIECFSHFHTDQIYSFCRTEN